MNFWSTVLGGSKDGNSSSCTTAKTSSGAEAGSGVSEDGGVSFGFSLLQGKRPNMEDFHHAAFQREPRSGQQCGFFGIFDGHGGPNAADFVRQNLFVNLLKNPQIQNDVHAAIVEAYVETDTQYLRQDASSGRDDGCTAVVAVVMGKRLLVANVGDSRAVLSRKGKAVAMSEDHKPNLPSERQRIENAGGVVVWAGTWRVSGVLAVSRAFGDRPLKRYVVAMPDIKEEAITKDDEFLVLASDGVWDVVSNQARPLCSFPHRSRQHPQLLPDHSYRPETRGPLVELRHQRQAVGSHDTQAVAQATLQ